MEPIVLLLVGVTALLLLGQVWNFVEHQRTQWQGRARP